MIYNGNPVREIIVPENYQPKLVSDKPFLFSIGEFTERKNLHTLVEMLKQLDDLNLILAGNNNTAYTQDILIPTIEKNKLEDRVIITGKISDVDKQYYLQNCKGFVFPSLREGFGIPPIEAMRFGKPVFLSNNTSLPEIGGKLANYWDNYDPEYMAKIVKNGLTEFYSDEENLSKLHTEHALSFNWNDAANSYAAVYRSLFKY